jgi:SOS response regulatory protein OraA/RecX
MSTGRRNALGTHAPDAAWHSVRTSEPFVAQPRKTITALRERPRGVEIELDGQRWRLVPAEAVVRSGLAVGRMLDRETARTLARELRRAEALGVAVRALRHRDRSRQAIDERLAARGAPGQAREEALAVLERAGVVDDARLAASRAQALAERGYGDAAIRFALEGEALAAGSIAEALAALEPEPERARRLFELRGADVRALRWLAARGFETAGWDDGSEFANEA